MGGKWGDRHPPCEWCGGQVVRREREQRCDFLKRKTCRETCRRAAQAEKRTHRGFERSCSVCEGLLERRPCESHHDFLLRKSCSHPCLRTLKADLARRHVEVDGIPLSTGELAELSGVTVWAIRRRIQKGTDPLTGRKEGE